MGGLKLANIQLCSLKNGYGAMCMRERLGGVVVDSKFASSWVGGVLMSLLGRMGWGYGRIL